MPSLQTWNIVLLSFSYQTGNELNYACMNLPQPHLGLLIQHLKIEQGWDIVKTVQSTLITHCYVLSL